MFKKRLTDSMRLIIRFKPLVEFDYYSIDKYDIQGFIYSLLKDSSYDKWHENIGFKFFNFSNIFPVTDFNPEEVKTLIVSSPEKELIKTLSKKLKNRDTIKLSNYSFELIQVKSIDIKNNPKIIAATPITLFENNKSNKYFSIKKTGDSDFFFKRLKDNAIKKYNAYYQEDYQLEEPIFDMFEYKKEVSIRVTIKHETFIVIGSLWKFEKDINKSNEKFYKFLFDCGYGEKNSLGMGFVNNWK